MLTKTLRVIISSSATMRRALWKQWYQILANRYNKLNWPFMNYGYANPNEKEKGLHLQEEDKEDRYFIQLYHHVASVADLSGKDVLEVGSGRGGGCSYIARYLNPKSIKGMDFSGNAVNLCNQRYSIPNLTFCQGDAEAMPFDDRSFDVILNVESSHCYGSMKKFVSEAVRVLKPGGIFSWADLRPQEEIPALNRIFSNSGLQLIKEKDITLNVIHALGLMNDRKLKLIKKHVPKLVRKSFKDFAGTTESKIYNALKQRKKIYLSKVFKSK